MFMFPKRNKPQKVTMTVKDFATIALLVEHARIVATKDSPVQKSLDECNQVLYRIAREND